MRVAGNHQWDDDYPNAEVFTNDLALGQLWVAEVGGELAGVAAFTTEQTPEYSEVGWDLTEPAIVIHRLAVHPDFRGQGIAAALFLQAETVARTRNIHVIRADTNVVNTAMLNLFPKLGYTFAGEIGLAFRPGLRFRCYEKRL